MINKSIYLNQSYNNQEIVLIWSVAENGEKHV